MSFALLGRHAIHACMSHHRGAAKRCGVEKTESHAATTLGELMPERLARRVAMGSVDGLRQRHRVRRTWQGSGHRRLSRRVPITRGAGQ